MMQNQPRMDANEREYEIRVHSRLLALEIMVRSRGFVAVPGLRCGGACRCCRAPEVHAARAGPWRGRSAAEQFPQSCRSSRSCSVRPLRGRAKPANLREAQFAGVALE